MANNLGDVVSKFTTRLDQVLVQESKTSDLNLNQDLLGEYQGNGEIKLANLALSGLADYDRAKGFASGDIALTWKSYKLEFDRGREFSIDALDDEEREMLISANVMAQFAREKVTPEVDAIRFARLCENAGEHKEETLESADAAWKAVLLAEESMQDNGADIASCILYVTPAINRLLREAMPWRMGQAETPDTRITTFDGMKMVVVPQSRFYSAVDVKDDGYEKSSSGRDVQFIVVNPQAAAALQKHEKIRYFAPDVNQDKDAHKWQYRLYHDLLVYEGKKGLIYASLKSE